jgi:SAM-dependent methyltransferase
MSFDATEFRARQRRVWSSGDWPDVATKIQPVADELIERVGVGAGQDLLDVGTGTGNVAIPAAARGARVTGVDITTELFDRARARAAAAGVDVEWVEGDAADLPLEDSSFDSVLSVFGCMFAPRHQDAADELVRVCRPGGVIGVCAWTPEGLNGQMQRMLGSVLPPSPPEVQPPPLWGAEDHVRELFEGTDVQLEFERVMAVWEWESPEAWVTYCEETLGTLVMAKSVLQPEGKWDDVRARIVDLFTERSPGGRGESEYLRTIGHRTG